MSFFEVVLAVAVAPVFISLFLGLLGGLLVIIGWSIEAMTGKK
jgi:hypothetical protein